MMIAIFIAIGSAIATYYGLLAWEWFTRCPARFSREWYQQEFDRLASDSAGGSDLDRADS